MGIFLSLLGNKNVLMGIILVSIIAGVGIYIAKLKGDIEDLEKDKVALIAEKNLSIAELQVSQASVKGLEAAISDQNSKIDKFKADADNRAAANAGEIKKAQATADIYKQQAAELLNSQPMQNMTKCDSANVLITREIKNAHIK